MRCVDERRQGVTGESINYGSFQALLRGLSQRRRQGLLQVDCRGSAFELSFFEGRIVSARCAGRSPTREICGRLARAGCLRRELLPLFADVDLSADQLYALLVNKGYIAEDDFIAAKIADETDLLHALRAADDYHAQFTPQLVQFSPELGLSVYPGQLLLDFFEFAASDLRFRQVFSDPQQKLRAVPSAIQHQSVLTSAEEAVLASMAPVATLQEVLDTTLLSEHEIREALLHLLSHKLITFESFAEGEETWDTTIEDFEIPAAEDNTMLGRVDRSQRSAAAEDSSTLSDSTDSIELVFSTAGHTEIELPAAQPETGQVSAAYPCVMEAVPGLAVSTGSRADDVSSIPAMCNENEQKAEFAQDYCPSEHDNTAATRQNPLMFLCQSLSDEKWIGRMAVILTLAFLLATAMMVSHDINHWLRSLADFPLKGSEYVIL